jgi:hypothetical protein
VKVRVLKTLLIDKLYHLVQYMSRS